MYNPTGLLLCVILLFSVTSAQNANTPAGVPIGAASLAFVFDITGSMYDDLVQVIEGAAKILDTTLERRQNLLYNYVLVPFHDPEVGPVLITTDDVEFQQQLKNLYVQGGGDCPEMSVTAIKEALDASLPNSFIYVFTDARSKDFDRTDEVLALIQQKQSQVVFVLTGDCGDPAHVGFRSFERIASTSSGQVFVLKKQQVNQVLNFVKVAVQARKVNLMSIDVPTLGTQTFSIPIDSNLQEFTVSVSGDRPKVKLWDPTNNRSTIYNGLEQLLNLTNVQILNVGTPSPGRWILEVSSSSPHTIRVTALSSTDFVAGFSRDPNAELENTDLRPLGSVDTYLIVNTSDLERPGKFEFVELVDLHGQVLNRHRLSRDPSQLSMYRVLQPFTPPDTYFYLKLTGKDEKGYDIQRLTPTAISPRPPPRPNVFMPPLTRGFYDNTAYVTCSVQSVLPFVVQWYRDGVPKGNELFYSESTNSILKIPYATRVDEGYYICNASNSAGFNYSTTFLDISEPNPDITPIQNVSVLPEERAVFNCIIYSIVPYNVTWFEPIQQKPIRNSEKYRVFPNGTLIINVVGLEDEGKYVCRSENEGGATDAGAYLRVKVPPKVAIEPEFKNFKTGETVNLTCSAQAYPPPKYYWLRDNKLMIANDRIRIQGRFISIANMYLGDAGLYQCLADNPAGEETANATLSYIEAPEIFRSDDIVLVANGNKAVLQCMANGIPDPVIRWYKGDIELRSLAYVKVEPHGKLIIHGTQPQDAGEYRCEASNAAGSDSAMVLLEVGATPSFTVLPTDVGSDIGTNTTLQCEAAGYPLPKILWRKNGIPLVSQGRYTQLPTGSLFIMNLEPGDEGSYVCEVQNQFGNREKEVYLKVTGVVRPAIENYKPRVDVKQGDDLELECVLLRGNPHPTLQWSKDGTAVPLNHVMVKPDRITMFYSDVQPSHEGEYRCVARNVAGESVYTVDVNVLIPPTLRQEDDNIQGTFNVVEGDPLTIPCHVDGDPRPKIKWFKDNEEIELSDPNYYLTHDGYLEIYAARASDTATYTCRATNTAGSVEKTINLFVEVRPEIAGKIEEEYTVIVGEEILLPCEVMGIPQPEVVWRRNLVTYAPVSDRIRITDQGILISPTELSDMAIYECVARNTAGKATKTITLIVQIPPRIIEEGDSDITVEVGGSVILSCEAEGSPEPIITWTKNGNLFDVTSDDRIRLEGSGTLVFPSASIADDAEYACEAENPAGTARREFTLTVQAAPTLPPDLPDSASSIESDNIILECPALGTPKPEVVWYKNDVRLSADTIGLNFLSDGSLEVLNTDAEDTGVYHCVATNDAGSVEHTVDLKVLTPPKLVDRGRGDIPVIESRTVIANDSLVLECTVTGDPPPVIAWKKNGRAIPDYEFENGRLQISNEGKFLTITRSRVTDTGGYTCEATNLAGETKKDFEVFVHVPPRIERPDSTRDNISTTATRTLSIDCPITGTPHPQITWYKHDELIYPNLDPNLVIKDGGRRLEITNTRVTDTGVYKCKGVNVAGETEKKFTVDIHIPPSIEDPQTIEKPEVLEDSALRLRCPASGIPRPTIKWYKNNTPLQSDPTKYALYDEGFTLEIKTAAVGDAARYTCQATNVAGSVDKSFDVNVLVKALIPPDRVKTDPRVVVNKTLTLNCPAEGNPIPEIVWYKNGVLLDVKVHRRYQILAEGRQLRIDRTQLNDKATYTCEATNKAGQSRLDFNPVVLVPSKILPTSHNPDRRVVVNGSLTIDCPAQGYPPPEITWYKDNQPLVTDDNIVVSDNGRRLQILSAAAYDSGRYVCRAVNEAGSSEIGVNVNVQEPPKISDDVLTDPKVITGESYSIYCPAEGLPPPTIRWYKNGNLLISDEATTEFEFRNGGRELFIQSVDVSDTGRYTCEASNEAGDTRKDYDLEVYVPPTIDKNYDNKTEVVRGRETVLHCPAVGVPLPRIEWYKDGRQLIYTDRYMILDGGRQLKIFNATILDTGSYRCVATNTAGRTSADMDLQVLVPPAIDESNTVYNPHVEVNRTVILECAVSGIPPPDIEWYINDLPVVETSRISFQNNNAVLQILNAQITDTNTYSCLASNDAGRLRKHFHLQIIVPPRIDRNVHVNKTISENEEVFFDCIVTGIPKPSIIWLKDRSPLLNTVYENLALSKRDQRLTVSNAKVEDAVEYKCIATNSAGQDRLNYHLAVQVAPTITDSSETETFTLIEGDSVELQCPVTGIPDPLITWSRDDAIIVLSQNSHIDIAASKQVLKIPQTRVSDSARYTCRAENDAGWDEKSFIVQIYVPPRINGSSGHQDKSVIIGEDLVLECPVMGVPPPDIKWLWHDATITSTSRFFKTEDRGQRLVIVDADQHQEGFFSCVVTNLAGKTSLNFTVTVLIPPKITDQVDLVTSLVEEHAVLPCEFGGYPIPVVSWKKNGFDFPLQSLSHNFNVGDIVFDRVRIEDEGTYECIVSNLVGKDSKTVRLVIQVPPVITTPRDLRFKVLQGRDIYLPCDSIGKPEPSIEWTKGYQKLKGKSNVEIFNNGTLMIRGATLRDSGIYTCSATNTNHFDSIDIELRVLVPPTIFGGENNRFRVDQGRKVILPCQVRGRPYPRVTWLKNGVMVDTSVSRYYRRRNRLIIASVRAEDAGTYECEAHNEAGRASVTRELIVLVPPHIEEVPRSITSYLGNTTDLLCIASGIPKPQITWYKDGQRIIGDAIKYVQYDSGMLKIRNLEASDAGSYRCEALNIAGNTSAYTALRVYEPPVITMQPLSQEIVLRNRIQLLCAAEGTPAPTIYWEKNGYPISTRQREIGQSLLIINDARRSDAGVYKCVAQNAAGRDEATATIIMTVPPTVIVPDGNAVVSIADRIILTCSVGGDPKPEITWTKNGREVGLSDRVQQLYNGSLVIFDATSSDAGEYECVATNDFGISKGVALLTVIEPPEFKIEPKSTIVDQGDTATLDCVAEGEPEPEIEWLRGTFKIDSQRRFSVLQNNSLRIVAAQVEDSGGYRCFASNTGGQKFVEVNLTVVVHGRYSEWSDWGICSSTCGHGIHFRSRTCTDPEPVNGGRQCIGNSLDQRSCFMADCPVVGLWGNWGHWEQCSSTCGPGERRRVRECNNPVPQHGGKFCEGHDFQYDACISSPCPVHGKWTMWSAWGHCDVTCGDGFRERSRICAAPAPRFGGNNCFGDATESQPCREPRCALDGDWGMWNEWSSCSQSCGGGSRSRLRDCNSPAPQYGGQFCNGRGLQIDYCNPDACPVHGNWAEWAAWGECSVSCNGGLKRRFRTCTNPSPSPDGRPCIASDEDTIQCNMLACPVDGEWGAWSAWSQCSATCDSGYRERQRVCNTPLYGGSPCAGDREQRDECIIEPCSRIPRKAAGNLVGFINNIDITDATISATMRPSDLEDGMIIDATINNVPSSISGHLRHLIDVLNPVFWTTAQELDGAKNGFSLTKGVFVREVQVQYPGGQIMKMSQYARGVDSNGVLQVDVIVRGTAPELASGTDVFLTPFRENYIQTGEDTLYAQSSRLFRTDGHFLPYAWNHSMTYTADDGIMPFLVEDLVVKNIKTTLDPSMTQVKINLQASIQPGDPSNQCPRGFDLETDGKYCLDDNECARQQPCSHFCHNSQGGFSCSCPYGFVLTGDGRNCEDINECNRNNGGCPIDRDCINTLGSFHCAMNCEAGFRRSLDGQSCKDIDECHETPEVCGQECKNVPGGYQCSCSRGFKLRRNGRCTDVNECRTGLSACSHICKNSIGSYKCACPPGLRLHNIHQCIDINECTERTHTCTNEQECVNADGSYKCVKICPTGYQLVGRGHCQDKDECRSGEHQCYSNQRCVNNEGSYSCQCDPGYRSTGPGQPCIDLNECEERPGICRYRCVNIFGGYECICPPGQLRLADRKSCAGLEFLQPSRVYSVPRDRINNDNPRPSSDASSPCGVGYRKCSGFSRVASLHRRRKRNACPAGSRYIPTHHECIDINECADNSAACQHDCINSLGSFKCVCPPGYKLGRNGRNCVDVDECRDLRIDCGVDKMCFNTRGDYRCIDTPCPTNYTRNQLTGSCVLECRYSASPCPPGSRYADVIEFKNVALPSGIPARQDLIKLTAYDHDDNKLEETDFTIIRNDPNVEFRIRDVEGSGILWPIQALDASDTFRITVKARSYDNVRQNIQYQTTFIIHISVSSFPY